ncbi:hypothetical protein ESA94_18615 [Lacibacter luteus]|uniref:Uncharacterized protein n=1 Tax=Lacibacter luteus TaxID=2508719 RepID=A0A4Q1CE34_9BACT|nr:hypothetical protein [Lacibacter luteus]RXK58029.1 hypothetical protein ESA94_18615 [Lacibacter luteus]
MKVAFLLSTFFSCLCINTSAQEIDSKIDSFTRVNNIDSFLVYFITCNDLAHSIDSCNQSPSLYLIWKKNGNFFIQKFEHCEDYKAIQISNENPLSFYFTNKEIISKEEIKSPVYYEYKKEKGRKYTIEVTSTRSHSCFYNIFFRTNINSFQKRIDSYNLDFTEYSDGKKSINTKYNNSTKLKQLIGDLKTFVNLTSFKEIN